MEVLVPVVIVTIAIGLLVLFLRRPTVVRPPGDDMALKSGAPKAVSNSSDLMKEIPEELNIDMSLGGKHVSIKGGKEIGWTLTRGLDKASLSPEFLRSVVIKSKDPLTADLLAKLTPGSYAGAPPEAQLHYPDSRVVVDSFESNRTSGGAAESRGVYKTTLATGADTAQVLAWYRDWLIGHGWQLSPPSGASAESSHEYTRASEHFRLAAADPETIAPILAMPIPVGTKTIYEVEYSNASTNPPTN